MKAQDYHTTDSQLKQPGLHICKLDNSTNVLSRPIKTSVLKEEKADDLLRAMIHSRRAV
jgi:hypothetical protein